jgi:hypothetical protein
MARYAACEAGQLLEAELHRAARSVGITRGEQHLRRGIGSLGIYRKRSAGASSSPGTARMRDLRQGFDTRRFIAS